MSTMRKPNVIAILVSDIHLSSKPPVCRQEVAPWFDVMADYLRQLRTLADKYNVPILCAGDVFDKWNSSAELINFALEHLPQMYAVPGQHDLPAHNSSEVHKSAYHTMVLANKIQTLEPGRPRRISKALTVTGFPWEFALRPNEHNGEGVHVALVHKFVWTKGKGFHGAPAADLATATACKLKGFDVAVFGDNHKPFRLTTRYCLVWNNGGFMRRSSDDVSREPHVGVLLENGAVRRKILDTSVDVIVPVSKPNDQEQFDMTSFVQELKQAGSTEIDYRQAVFKTLRQNKIHPNVQQIVKECLA